MTQLRVVLTSHDGLALDETAIAGTVVTTYPALEREQAAPDLLILRCPQPLPLGDEEDPDHFVGSVLVLYWDWTRHAVEIAWLNAPPPHPFGPQDLSCMWSDVTDRGLRPILSQPGQGLGELEVDFAALASELNLVGLREAVTTALLLLDRWPVEESSSTFIRPLELSGGREQEVMTERLIGLRIMGLLVSDRVLPERSVRRRADYSLATNSQVAEIAHKLGAQLRQLSESSLVQDMAHLLDEVSRRARPPRPSPDRPFSSWDPLLKQFYLAALLSLSAPVGGDRSGGRIPMCRLFDLWEAWTETRIYWGIVDRLGPPVVDPRVNGPSESWVAQWRTKGSTLELASQRSFGSADAPLFVSASSPKKISSITSTLRPDLSLVHGTKSFTRLVLVDAKKRLRPMKGSDVGPQGSKYLWGLRLQASEAPAESAVDHVLIVAPVMAVDMFEPPKARIGSVRLLPSDSQAIADLVEKLLALAELPH